MRAAQIVAPALGAILAIGCAEPNPTEVTEGPLFRGSGQVLESVTGAGNFVGPHGEFFRTFTDVAHLFADGSIKGSWERVNHNRGSSSNGRVTCFTIDGNQAWLGGIATSGVASTPPNNEVGWFVIDNGQGANALPDVMSLQWVGREPGFASRFCATQPPVLRSFDITGGNIQVRP